MIASIVDTSALLKVLWTATLAGVGVTAIFAIAIVGATRAVDLSRERRPVEAVAFGVIGALALAAVLAAIAGGIVVMTQK
jgi:hypothetical protein